MSDQILVNLQPKAVAKKSLEKNEHLFHRGDPVHALFLATEGCVNLLRYHVDGSRAVLQRSASPTIIAEASVFSDHYHCDAVAATQTDILAVPIGVVRDLLYNEPAFARLGHGIYRTSFRAPGNEPKSCRCARWEPGLRLG
ncbi:cyclic nucleotide-binding domain-containing protein [Sinorhizobium meliloti]|uniref:cyclic nucleotide-binding domain-containing protein n=2 Tax=Sinorhizobium TaxID=28105 RepID=UPI0026D5DE0B